MSNFKRNIVKAFPDKEPFWGKYVDLNNVSVPELSTIQKYQLKKIEEFQKASLAGKQKYDKINQLFLSGKINTFPEQYAKDGDKTLDQILTELVGRINSTYRGNKSKEKGYNYEYLNMALQNLKNILQTLNKMLNRAGQSIPQSYLDTLNATINACGIGSLDDKTLESWFLKLNKFKGDLIEDIGVAWLNSLRIPELQSINTGALNLQGDISKGRHRGQVIQDLMWFDVSIPDLQNLTLTYRPVGETSQITTSLKDFFSTMEKASSQNKQIIITDEAYDTLLNLSALNFQAKSGLNQIPWNVNKSTQVSIGEFSTVDGLNVSAVRTFELLHTLDQEKEPERGIWVKNTSKDYNMLADYGLSTVLFKILHLSEKEGNQYLLTPQGFTTYTDRIAALMRKRQSRIHIKEQVSINNNTLSTKYTVGMTNFN